MKSALLAATSFLVSTLTSYEKYLNTCLNCTTTHGRWHFHRGFISLSLSFARLNISDDKQFKITSVDIRSSQLFLGLISVVSSYLYGKLSSLCILAVLRFVCFGFVPFIFVNAFINLWVIFFFFICLQSLNTGTKERICFCPKFKFQLRIEIFMSSGSDLMRTAIPQNRPPDFISLRVLVKIEKRNVIANALHVLLRIPSVKAHKTKWQSEFQSDSRWRSDGWCCFWNSLFIARKK